MKIEVDVEQFRNDWALALMTKGVIVKVKASRWAGCTSLKPEILGLKYSSSDSFEFMGKYVRLGSHKLLPPTALNEIDALKNLAYENLKDYSFDTVWGRFVPFQVFKEWEQANELIRKDFYEQARIFGEKYDSIVAEVKEQYKVMAKDVWFRLYPNQGNPTPAFIESFISRIVQEIPPRSDILSSFKYSFTYFFIPMPSFLQDDIAKAEKIKNQVDIDKLNTELEMQAKQIISQQYIERKKELIDDFLESTVNNLRSHVKEICDGVLQSLRQKSALSKITHTQIKRLKNMIKKVKMLNFYNDKEINVLLGGLGTEIEKVKDETNKDVIIHKLEELIEVAKKEYIPINDTTIDYIDI